MHRAVISDASCFIILAEIGALDLLFEAYGEVTTTPTIVAEVRISLPEWVKVQGPIHIPEFPASIDPGEASAIALALEIKDCILIIDEKTARNHAIRLGLEVTGTLGVIVKAKLEGAVPSIRPYVEAIKLRGFRFSPSVEAEAYRRANEPAN